MTHKLKRKVQVVLSIDNAKQEILLLRMNKKRHHLWQNITGSVEANEDFMQGAQREAMEETGLAPSNIQSIRALDLEFSFIDQWQCHVTEKVFHIICHESFNIVLDPNEHDDYQFVPFKNIGPDNVHYESNYLAIQKAFL